MEASGQALTAIIGGMLAELRGAQAPPVRLESDLERDLGIDSLARVELTLRIERAFGVRLAEERVLGARSVGDLLAALAAAAPRLAPQAAVAAPLAAPGEALAHPADAKTLLEVLDWHAARHAERTHVTLIEGDEAGETLTYADLAWQARTTARALERRGIEPGQAVAIMLPTGRAYFTAFFGVLAAGAVPVPLYPPFRWTQIEEHLRRQARILANCAATLLITAPQVRPVARLLRAQVPELRQVVSVDELGQYDGTPSARLAADDVALLQYTSGSTGQPKGVVLTHANLLANIRAMGEAAAASSADVFVSWLPLYHDMGLIGAWLASLYYAVPLAIMPTQAFLARPSRWLWAIHRYRATLSAGPNFAYEIAATKVPDDELEGLDLSSWRLAFNGAEPVRAATLERFARRFAPHGFDARAATPVYGLAESALGLTFPPLGRGPLVDEAGAAGVRRVVSCGRPLPGHEVRVVDESGREAPERVEGEVQFRGPSAARGYYRNPEATRALHAGDWLVTGDVGYFARGELYITSRVKELIVRGGHNLHPYDLEEAVGALPGVRKGCVAVFGATDRASGTERVVVLAETRLAEPSPREALRKRIAELSLEHIGVPADDIVLAAPRTVLKTSSGKIRRASCRQLYESGALGAAGERSVALQVARLALAATLGSLHRLARRTGRGAYALYAWTLFVLISAAGSLVLVLLPTRAMRDAWLQAGARLLLRVSLLPVRVERAGAPPLPAVFIANHSSYVDSLVLAALLPAGVRFVAKQELARAPVLGWLLRLVGTRFVERFDTGEALGAARNLTDAALSGVSLLFFPEATFTRAPGLRDFHLGAFVAAAQSGLPVVPVALRGTRSVLRADSWLPRRVPVEVYVGKAIYPRGPGWDSALALRDAARAAILEHCGEIIASN